MAARDGDAPPRRERPPQKKKKKLVSTKNQLRSVERLLSKARAHCALACAARSGAVGTPCQTRRA